MAASAADDDREMSLCDYDNDYYDSNDDSSNDDGRL